MHLSALLQFAFSTDFDSFQTTKRHSYDGYYIYIAIFNSFHEAVYPVGVTTN